MALGHSRLAMDPPDNRVRWVSRAKHFHIRREVMRSECMRTGGLFAGLLETARCCHWRSQGFLYERDCCEARQSLRSRHVGMSNTTVVGAENC